MGWPPSSGVGIRTQRSSKQAAWLAQSQAAFCFIPYAWQLVLLSALVSDAEPEAAAPLSLADASAVAAADESVPAALEDTELSSCVVAAATSSTPVPSSVVADVTEGRANIHARSTESVKASALFPVMRAFALPWGAFCCVRFLSATTRPSLPTSRDKNFLDQGL